MLIVISGSEELALNQKTKEVLEKRGWKDMGVLYHDLPSIDALQESAASQDLFGDMPVRVFRELEDGVY